LHLCLVLLYSQYTSVRLTVAEPDFCVDNQAYLLHRTSLSKGVYFSARLLSLVVN